MLTRASWIAFFALLAMISTAGARELHPDLRAFYPTGEYDLVIGGKKVGSELLFSSRAASYLLTPAGSKVQYLIAQRTRTVSIVTGTVVRQTNGDVDLPKDVTLESVGSAVLRKGDILLDAGTLQGHLTPRPPALGQLTGAAVLGHSPQYGLVMRAYKSEKASIRQLKTAKGVRVEAYFGSWCSRCQQQLGNMLALEGDLKGSGIEFSYYGLPAPPGAWKERRYLKAKIKGLPAAVVYVDDKVIGRLGPGSWKHLDSEIAGLLKGR